MTLAQLYSTTAMRAYLHACLFTREWESVARRHRCPQNGVTASICALDWAADAQLADSYRIAAVADIAYRVLLRAPFDLRASIHQQSLTIIDLLHPQQSPHFRWQRRGDNGELRVRRFQTLTVELQKHLMRPLIAPSRGIWMLSLATRVTCLRVLETTICLCAGHHIPGDMSTAEWHALCMKNISPDTPRSRHHLQHVCQRTAGHCPPLLGGGAYRVRTPQQPHDGCTRLCRVAVERKHGLRTGSLPG